MKGTIFTSIAASMEQPNGDRDDDLLVESNSEIKPSDIEQNSFFIIIQITVCLIMITTARVFCSNINWLPAEQFQTIYLLKLNKQRSVDS